MNQHRRRLLQAGLGAMAAAAVGPTLAQGSDSAIRFVIPTPAGGGFDTMMRLVGQKLTEAWGQPAIVDPRPGASGMLAIRHVIQSPPDGRTLLQIHTGLLTNLALQPNPGYRLEDLKPVCMLVMAPITLGVRRSLGVNTLQEFIAMAKARPGKLTYASYGPGSGGHFVGELLNLSAGIQTVHVPYKGEAPAIQDLLGEQVDAAVVSLGGASRHPDKIKPLAVASPMRSVKYPDVPTFAEAGQPQVNMPGWGAILAPAATPQPMVDKLSAELSRIIRLPDVSQRMLDLGFESVGWDAARLSTFLKEQMATVKRLVDEGRVKV